LLVENEVASPWPPLRISLGFEMGDSCVTVAAAEGGQVCAELHRQGAAVGTEQMGEKEQPLPVGGLSFFPFPVSRINPS